MNKSHRKGLLAELKIECDLISRGYELYKPIGEGGKYDIILYRNGKLEKMHCKNSNSVRGYLIARNRSTVTGLKGNKSEDRIYEDYDWLAIYDETIDKCFYLPYSFTKGKNVIHLRTEKALNEQKKNINWANDFEVI